MKRHRKILVGLFIAAPVLPLACSSGDDVSDSGVGNDATAEDAAKDATLDAAKDVTLDVKAKDAPAEVLGDVVGDAISFDAGDAGDGSAFVAPTCDGVVSVSEYGGTAHATTSGSQTWYMTWDATNLYVALDTATLTEASIIYVGFSGFGLMTAQVYDGTGGSLPFKADGVVYAKSTYQESRIGSIDAGTSWGSPDTTSVKFCGNGTTRELVVPWTAMHDSTVPSQFDFLAYATSSSGFVYAQIPTNNPSGNIGTSATFGHFFLADAGSDPFANPQ